MTPLVQSPEPFQRWYLSIAQRRRIEQELRRWVHELTPVSIDRAPITLPESGPGSIVSPHSPPSPSLIDFEMSSVATDTEALFRLVRSSQAGTLLSRIGDGAISGGSPVPGWIRRDCAVEKLPEEPVSSAPEEVALVFSESVVDWACGVGQLTDLCRSVVCGGAVPIAAIALDWGQTDLEHGLVRYFEECSGLGIDLFQSTSTPGTDPDRIGVPRWLVVGVDTEREITPSAWFAGEGDAILLLGEPVDPSTDLQGVERSLWWHQVRRNPAPSPVPVNLPLEAEALEGLRMLLLGGRIRSALACGKGGLACATIAGVLGASPSTGATLDLSDLLSAEVREGARPVRWDAVWFGEARGRVVVTTSALDAGKVMAQARILGIPAALVGRTGGDCLRLKIPSGEVVWPLEPWRSSAGADTEGARGRVPPSAGVTTGS